MKLGVLVFALVLNVTAAWSSEVLIVGDSQSTGFFGSSLYNEITQGPRASTARMVALVSASGTTFSSTNPRERTHSIDAIDRSSRGTTRTLGRPLTSDRLSTLIAAEKPKTVVIQLGDNFAGFNISTNSPNAAADGIIRAQVEKMMSELALANPRPRCAWITPTWRMTTGGPKTNERMERVIAVMKESMNNRCTLIDSTRDLGLTAPPLRPGNNVHPNKTFAEAWGTAAGRRISELTNAAVPVRAAAPSTANSRAGSR